MKKALLFVLILTFGINFNIKAYDFYAVYNGDTIYYNIISSIANTVEVTSRVNYYNEYSNGYTEVISIPSSVSYNKVLYNVISIGIGTFQNCSELNSINIPNSVTLIGAWAFDCCSRLTSITCKSTTNMD
ncbi:MAG: leucine-rich repeat protein [Bacteroidales bacterium]